MGINGSSLLENFSFVLAGASLRGYVSLPSDITFYKGKAVPPPSWGGGFLAGGTSLHRSAMAGLSGSFQVQNDVGQCSLYEINFA